MAERSRVCILLRGGRAVEVRYVDFTSYGKIFQVRAVSTKGNPVVPAWGSWSNRLNEEEALRYLIERFKVGRRRAETALALA